jgi:hypothetical protein
MFFVLCEDTKQVACPSSNQERLWSPLDRPVFELRTFRAHYGVSSTMASNKPPVDQRKTNGWVLELTIPADGTHGLDKLINGRNPSHQRTEPINREPEDERINLST